ncbi:MAG: ribosome hibernation-promoting factor, HPF/YfiA family [Phycisphaerales bacterium]
MRLEIRSAHASLSEALREWSKSRILFAVGRFRGKVEAVRVLLADVNGPRGGVDQRCVVEVRVRSGGLLVAEVVDTDLYSAISRAADRIARRVRDSLERAAESRRAGGRKPSRR